MCVRIGLENTGSVSSGRELIAQFQQAAFARGACLIPLVANADDSE